MIIILGFAIYSIIINYIYNKKVSKLINPVSVISIVFIIVFIFHTTILGDVSDNYFTYFVIIAGVVSFQLPFIVINIVKSKSKNNRDYLVKISDQKIRNFVHISFIALLFNSFLNTIEVMSICNWNISVFLLRNTYVREIYLSTHTSLFISILGIFLSLLVFVGICSYAISISRKMHYKYHYFFMFLWFLLFIYAGIITMSKTITVIYIALFCISYTSSTNSIAFEKKTLKKVLPFATITIFILLSLIGFQRNYFDSKDNMMSSVIDKVNEYVVVPTEAFRELLLNYDSTKYGNGKYTFTTFERVATRLGLLDGNISNQEEPIRLNRMGNNTNVFTWFGPMFKDFGVIGVVMISLLYGVIFGAMYSTNMNSIEKVYINSMIVTVILFSFFAMKTTETIYLLYFIFAYFIGKYQMNGRRIKICLK